jgi:hypothetical protein
MSNLPKKVQQSIIVPSWLPWFYGGGAVLFVPWIVYLQCSLPIRHPLPHWSLTWVGFDIAVFLVILTVVYLAVKKSHWLNLALVSLATLMFIDPWFDILTSVGQAELVTSVSLAVFAEIPLALVSLWNAIRISRQLSK